VLIRAATSDDIPLMMAIERTSESAAHWASDQYRTRVETGCVLIAERDGTVRGFLCARIAAGDWEIENVVVVVEFRRQGVAAALMETLLEKWQSAGGSALHLEVRESNMAARRLYQNYGLCEVGRRREYYRQPVEDAVLYSLSRVD
jgi:[ribosomal protein S18]-alanine N-acetyltransferase